MKKLVVVALIFTTYLLNRGVEVEGRHYETTDTIVIEGTKLDEQAGDGLVEGQKKYPHLAAIMKNGKQVCAGSLIDNTHVLTTAYCVQNITSEEISRLQVGIGYQSFNDDTPVELREKEGPYYLRRVLKVIMDRSFYYQSQMAVIMDPPGMRLKFRIQHLTSEMKRNSLVILKLDATMTYNDYVDCAHLSDNTTLSKLRTTPLKTGKLSGWRKSKDAAGKEISFLRGVTLRIHSYDECQKEYLYSKKMDDIICASNAQTNPCYYELGSPLTARRNGKTILIGIRERDCHFPNIFTRIDYFLPWVKKNLIY